MKRYKVSTHPEMVPVIHELEPDGTIIRTLTYRSAAWMKVWRNYRDRDLALLRERRDTYMAERK